MSSPTGIRPPRGRRGTSATIVAVLVVLVCAAGATEALWLALYDTTLLVTAASVISFGRDTHLNSPLVLTVAIVAAVLGLLLLITALVPPPRRLVELSEPEPAVAVGLTRASLTRTLIAAATGIDGITHARVKGRRHLTVVATTALRDTTGLADRVQDTVTARLSEFTPARPRTVRVRLRRKDR